MLAPLGWLMLPACGSIAILEVLLTSETTFYSAVHGMLVVIQIRFFIFVFFQLFSDGLELLLLLREETS